MYRSVLTENTDIYHVGRSINRRLSLFRILMNENFELLLFASTFEGPAIFAPSTHNHKSTQRCRTCNNESAAQQLHAIKLKKCECETDLQCTCKEQQNHFFLSLRLSNCNGTFATAHFAFSIWWSINSWYIFVLFFAPVRC